MPRVFKKRKPRRRVRRSKKTYRKRFQLSGTNAVRSNLPYPDRFMYRTRYIETSLSLDPGIGGTSAEYVFSCNGLYDPNITGGGHQPIGFDQVMQMYNHYTVIAARIRVSISNFDGSNDGLFGCYVSASSAATVDPRVAIENGACNWKYLAVAGRDKSTLTLIQKVAPLKFLGKKTLDDNEIRGSVSSNPTEQCYFHVFLAPNNTNNMSACPILVQIDYVSVLTEPSKLVLS